MRFRVISAKNRSTMLSQEAEVGTAITAILRAELIAGSPECSGMSAAVGRKRFKPKPEADFDPQVIPP
jgi:hypothetical protein